ncbi:hypothetical protein [Psychromicrobium sp. YIM B11713]|uniref:hypothetical protein n=1 Tax=Psychromicrobium sp. YIM B11713 TaxID=3145233 RepID=UPI00374E3105
MADKSKLELETTRTIKFLTDEGLLTDEHAGKVALLEYLVEQLPKATNLSQSANVAVQIRAVFDSLPKVPEKPADELQDFVDSLSDN